MTTRMLSAPELELLVRQHVADFWQEEGSDVAVTMEFMRSFGIEPSEMVRHAAIAADGPVSHHTQIGRTAILMQGLLLGLDLARQLETASLRIEADHFREAAVAYGRILQAVIGREGGALVLDEGELLNDTAVVTPNVEDGKVIVTLEQINVDGA